MKIALKNLIPVLAITAFAATPLLTRSALATVEAADDIIPAEEMATARSSFLDSLTPNIRQFRAQSQAQLTDHDSRRVQIVVKKTMKETGFQHMDVLVDGSLVETFKISTAYERSVTGKSGRTYFAATPDGKFLPDGMQAKRWSNLWQVNLQYVLRFSGGVWIHATTPDHYAELGAPASGGCVRLHLDDAEKLYKIVTSYGMSQTAITVVPAPGEPQVPPKKRK